MQQQRGLELVYMPYAANQRNVSQVEKIWRAGALKLQANGFETQILPFLETLEHTSMAQLEKWLESIRVRHRDTFVREVIVESAVSNFQEKDSVFGLNS